MTEKNKKNKIMNNKMIKNDLSFKYKMNDGRVFLYDHYRQLLDTYNKKELNFELHDDHIYRQYLSLGDNINPNNFEYNIVNKPKHKPIYKF